MITFYNAAEARYNAAEARLDGRLAEDHVMTHHTNYPFKVMKDGTQRALFPLGRLLATPGAIELIERLQIDGSALLLRHVTGDWGDIAPEDRGFNEEALREDARIFSVYRVDQLGERVSCLWVITEADRSATTILLPDDD